MGEHGLGVKISLEIGMTGKEGRGLVIMFDSFGCEKI
jgi:hypothetical protein